MPMISISIAPSVFATFPHVEVGGLGIAFPSPGHWQAAVAGIQAEIVEACRRLNEHAQITDHPSIATWRAAYAKMGVKASRFRSSIESLLRRAQKQQFPHTGLPIVDFYNGVSLLNAAPLGGYDAAKLGERSIELRLCRPDKDVFLPLGADPTDFPMKEGVVVYGSGNDVLCWGFNCRDSKLMCIDGATTAAVFFSETADGTRRPEVILNALGSHARNAGGRCGSIAILSKDISTALIDMPI